MMVKQLLSTTALVLALSAPAWAQTATDEAPATGQGQTTEEMDVQTTDQPATGTAETEGLAEEPATDTGETGMDMEEEPAVDSAATGTDEAVIAEEQEGQMKAEDLMGMSVISGQGEEIGQVEDLIFDQNEQITGVVVGVGGFLGIGQKLVALNWNQAEVQQNPDTGEDVVLVGLTREELEAAPEFKTMEEQEAEAQQQMEGTGGTVEAVPDAGTAAPQ